MFQKLGDKFRQFMIGRNGPDDLARFALFLAVLCIIFNMFFSGTLLGSALTFLTFVLVVYTYWRMCSRNLSKREAENRSYVSLRTKVTGPFRQGYSFLKDWMKYHKEYRIYRCKQCGQTLRVPKGKGTVKVTCPKCKRSFTSHT